MSARQGSPGSTDQPPVATAAILKHLVDGLIPGQGHWPSASAVGVQGLLAARILEEWGEGEIARIVAAVEAAGGLAGEPGQDVATLGRLEAAEPDLFERLRVATVLAYYEHPIVIEAIQRSGRPYAVRPHVTGYPMPPFDPARDTPRHGRGSYIPTEAVQKVDISGLDLDGRRTETWGTRR